jgi:hypothetical protein
MTSHHCAWRTRDLLKVAGPPAGALVGITLALHGAAALGLLPPPEATLDPDRTVLVYKSEASRAKVSAEILLLGDSSCLMGVDAPQLSALLPGHAAVLNLGLILGLSLAAYGAAPADSVANHPGRLRAVVLLVTPEKLTKREDAPYFDESWRRFREGRFDLGPPADLRPVQRWLGVGIVRERLLPHVLDRPLKGQSVRFYGFVRGLRDYLVQHRGSLVEFGSYRRPVSGEPVEYHLAPALEAESRRLRAAVPGEARFLVGLTPIPESLAGAGYPQQRDELLVRRNQWLGADTLLTNLPPTLPDGLFASGAHLNERGQRRFTSLLARELASSLSPQNAG